MSQKNQFHELTFYTLAHPDQVYFIHQHVVDAYFAQQADEHSKPIGIAFSLIGLYLYLEHGYTGRQVQRAHMELAKYKTSLPSVKIPLTKGDIGISQILECPAGAERDAMIRKWCASVWQAYSESHAAVTSFIREKLNF